MNTGGSVGSIDSMLAFHYCAHMTNSNKDNSIRTVGGAIFTDIILEVFRLNGRLIAEGDKLVSHLGLTSARWQVLGAIIEEELLTVSQIARKMGLQRQSVQRIVDVLATDEYVNLVENPNDQRAKLVKLSRKGRTLLNKVNKIQTEWSNRIASGFQNNELKSTRTILSKLRQEL